MKISGVDVTPGIYPKGGYRDKSSEGLVNRQRCRETLLIKEVVKRFSFNGATILDVGCNCGYWSSIYITKYGAVSMVGVEGRDLFVKQGNLYYWSLGIKDKGVFIKDNVVEHEYSGSFDFVLCAGILYHVREHRKLLRKIAQVNKKVLVIDTRVSGLEGEDRREPADFCFNSIPETRHSFIPGKKVLLDVLHEFGYHTEIIMPRFKTVAGVDGDDNYNISTVKGIVRPSRRICIFCEK